MIYAIASQEYAMSELAASIRAAQEAKWYRRLKIVQLSITGETVPKLSEQFDVCQATVRNYIKAYNCGGIENLRPEKPPGRPKKVGQLQKDDWALILSQTPNRYEKLETDSRQWTLELLVVYAKEYLNAEVDFSSISKAMKRCGYRTGRSKRRASGSRRGNAPPPCVSAHPTQTILSSVGLLSNCEKSPRGATDQ